MNMVDGAAEREPAGSETVYVSITGLRLKRARHIFRFFIHASASLRQARKVPGNLRAEVKTINGVRHTMTVWESKTAMRRFLYRGAHAQAIRAFPTFATGKTFGFETRRVPGWDEVHALWLEHGREYAVPEHLEMADR